MQRKRVLRSSWILNECNLSCKIVKNCRIIGLNRTKKNKFWPWSVWLKKTAPHSTVYLRRDEKVRLLYTPPDLSPRLTCKVTWSITKDPAWFFYFGHPFKQRNAMCKLAATEDYRVFHNIIFRGRGCPIIHSLSNGVVGELSINLIKLRWWATGLSCLGRISFSGLIDCDRTCLPFLGVHIRLLTRKISFTFGLSNYISLKPLSLCLKVRWMCHEVNWFVDYLFIVRFKSWSY